MEVNNRKNMIFMVIGAITLIAVTLGATYAYFTAQSADGANIDTDVMTGTTDNLAFSFGDEINIYATEENFGKDMGSISDSTTGQAILKANNTTNEATARYNIYLIIENNDFVYTTEEGTPEIVLNVTDPNGNKVENITGLVHYENGFDITTRTGGYLLVPDYEISATDVQTVQDWNIEVTLVNLDSDQNANTGKSLTGKLYITQEQMSSYELTQINNIITSTTYNSVEATLDLTNGSAPVSKYYYGIEKVNNTRSVETVEYVESDIPSYKFASLEPNTEYTVYSYVEDENKIKSNVYETTVETGDFVAPNIKAVSHSETLSSISITVDAQAGSNEIVKYMYSKDNGDTWEESDSNTYTFDNLTDSTEYKVKIKVVDSEGNESPEYYEAITTEIYILPVVNSVEVTTTWNSITLTPSGTNGTNAIDHYEYSINNGVYQESNAFGNLSESTSYDINVKAIDSIGRESNIYTLQVTTDAYKLPTISLTTSSTTNSIKINVNATSGDGNVVSYHYSRDNGSNYTASNSNSYTFSNLTSNTTYYIKVYVTDSNGRNSSEYAITVSTLTTNKSSQQMLASLGLSVSSGSPTFNNTSCSSGCDEATNGIYQSTDDDGVVYYWRGTVNNNWVRFAGLYWRILRINGDGSVRLIYNGNTTSTTGTGLQIGLGAYNSTLRSTYSMGYTYTTNLQRPNQKNTGTASSIKSQLDSWYNSNLSSYTSYIEQSASYCNDREAAEGYEWQLEPSTIFYYASRDRLFYGQSPSFGCANNIDEYTTNIGLITADEIIYAGGSTAKNNTLYYLYTGQSYWTMTPVASIPSASYVLYVDENGMIQNNNVSTEWGVRPVINLKNTTNFTGNGTASNPYTVQ